jgi:hypothetical protein
VRHRFFMHFQSRQRTNPVLFGSMVPSKSRGLGGAQPNSAVEADVALSRCAPSGPRSLTPVVRQTRTTCHYFENWTALPRSRLNERSERAASSLLLQHVPDDERPGPSGLDRSTCSSKRVVRLPLQRTADAPASANEPHHVSDTESSPRKPALPKSTAMSSWFALTAHPFVRSRGPAIQSSVVPSRE